MIRITPDVELVTPDGFTLRGHLSCSAKIGPAAVLFVHGFGSEALGNKSRALEARCARRGWTFVAIDLRGHGSSDGTLADLRVAGLLTDLKAIRLYLAGRGVERLFLVGSSMGGFASAWFADREPDSVPALALIAPAFGFPHGLRNRLGDEASRAQWQQTGWLSVRNEGRGTAEKLAYALLEEANGQRLEDLAGRWRHPAIVFHSLRDDTVPAAGSMTFVQAVACPAVELRLYTDGDHRHPTNPDTLALAVVDFFARSWPSA